MFEFLIVLVSVKNKTDFYCLILFVYRKDNPIFSLIYSIPLKACIVEILQFFTILRLWVSPE